LCCPSPVGLFLWLTNPVPHYLVLPSWLKGIQYNIMLCICVSLRLGNSFTLKMAAIFTQKFKMIYENSPLH
jgi:hypothetical protein